MSTAPTFRNPHGIEVPDTLSDVADVAGNASDETKAVVKKWLWIFGSRGGPGFADDVNNRVAVREVSIIPKVAEPQRKEGRVVTEITVEKDMINSGGMMHGGCAIFLVDICSTLPITALSWSEGGDGEPGVSQAINTVFHAPAPLGAKLRLVNTSLTLGARAMSCRTEIWDETNHRLVVSGVQIRMLPSPAKL